MRHVVIIGNGIAGITAARHIRKLGDDRITVISAETEHFFSRTALMYIYMGHMKFEHTKPYEDWFWAKNKIDLKKTYVERVDSGQKQLHCSGGEVLSYDSLIIATGSKSNKFGWPGQDLPGVQGLYSYQDLELMELNTQAANSAVIVGGGLIGIEMAEMLMSRGIAVTFLIMEDGYWRNVLPKEDADLIGRHAIAHGVDLKLGTQLKEIVAGDDGRVAKVVTDSGEEIICDFVGLTPGVSPNVDFLSDSGIDINRGVLVDDQLKTNVDNVYAIGDCAEIKNPNERRRPIEAVWYTGRMMGETVARTICGKPTRYNPGFWFNSAKFFDIEYQTYGYVAPNLLENEDVFYWEHEAGEISLRLVFDKNEGHLLGINVFGIRLKHEVCESWLRNKSHVQAVMKDLHKANFDPEFFSRYEHQIAQEFNKRFPGLSVDVKKRGLFSQIFS